MNTERIIEAVSIDAWESVEVGAISPIIPPLVNLAMSGVCPECFEAERGDIVCKNCEHDGEHPCPADYSPAGECPKCTHPYHDHREALDALLAERG